MRMILAEKPSVAQSIAAVLGADQKKNGYLQGENDIVSWCIGHLIELAPPEIYDARYAKWRREDLPIVPSAWESVISDGTKKQFAVLKDLLNRTDVDEVVCATDAGREGELIFRMVYEKTGCTKPVKRLWISSLEESAIRDGFRSLKPGTAYDALYRAALCRAQADWLVGINGTRLYSRLYGIKLNVGRVMTPTLAMVAQREKEIAAFQVERFYTVQLSCGFLAQSGRMKTREEAERIRAACHCQKAAVKHIERRQKKEKPPKLYDLTALQREANRVFGYTAKQTLDYAQSLYEKKLLTYPRTDSRYLTADMAETASAVLHLAAKVPPFDGCAEFFPDVTLLVNDGKVSDHHAIIPTLELEKADLSALPVGERNILLLVCRELLCAAAEPYVYEAVTATFTCGGQTFTAKGRRILSEGWREIDHIFRASLKEQPEGEAEPAALPDFTEGQLFDQVEAAVTEHFTAPPKAYTEDTLLAAMETAGKDDMPEDAERKGLGTPATRAAILEKLVAAGFVERKGKSLIPTKAGINLVTVLPDTLTSPMLTAEWEQKLTGIARGEADPASFMDGISEMTRELVKNYSHISEEGQKLFAPEREVVGLCPRCGKPVIKTGKVFQCSTNRREKQSDGTWRTTEGCGWRAWTTVAGKTVTDSAIRRLLAGRKVSLKGFTSKKGSKFDASLVVDKDRGVIFDFGNKH